MAYSHDKGWLTSLERADKAVFAILRFILITIIAAMVAAVLAQVFARYALDFSLNWSEELARICMICLVFLGAAILSRQNEHLAVTTIIEIFPPRFYHLFVAGAQLIGIYCTVYLAQGAWAALGREWSQLTPALQLPFGFIYSVIFLSVCLMLVWLAVNLLREALMAFGFKQAEHEL